MQPNDREQTNKLHNHQLTREENLKLLFNLINSSESMTRVDLVHMTGLSPSTVSSLVDALVRDRLVNESGLARTLTGAGRRPVILDVRADGRQIPVFSLCRWGVTFTLFDLQYNVLEQIFRPHICELNHPATTWSKVGAETGSGEEYIRIVKDILVNQSKKFEAKNSVGILISYPGVFLEEEQAFMLTSMQISFSKELIDALEEEMSLPVFLGNSSMNLAYAEKKRLEADGINVQDLVYVNVCDGVGSGIICNGEMFMRSNRMSGEIGHVTVEVGGRPCPCGNNGCLERYVNVHAIIESVREAVGHDKSGQHMAQLRALLENPTLKKIGEAYDLGIESVCTALNDIAEKLYVGIYGTVIVTGIKWVIIGGIEDIGEGFLNRIRFLFNGNRDRMLLRGVKIIYPQNNADADSIGLAQYYIDKIFTITNG